MNQVLGTTAGNALEVAEALAFLTGGARDPRLAEVTQALTAEALVLAADALGRCTPASGLFRGEGLPSHLDLTEPAPAAPVEPAVRSPGSPGPG